MSQTDFARFIEIATGSVLEVVSQAFIGQGQRFLNEESFRALYSAADEIGRTLSGPAKIVTARLNLAHRSPDYQLSTLN